MAALATPVKAISTGSKGPRKVRAAFLFPGQGAQHIAMGRELYSTESVFRQAVDRCSEILRADLNFDLRDAYFRGDGPTDPAIDINATEFAQPAIFVCEYALAQLWLHWGIEPECVIGHSVGEFAAGTIAGVMSLQDALHLVATRGRLMQQLPAGEMLSVRLGEAEILPLLGSGVSLAAVNSPQLSVASGSVESIGALEAELTRRNIVSRRLQASHAFHSAMMDPILPDFAAVVQQTPLSQPKLPFVSCVTGDWITPEQATDGAYWTRHISNTVRFAQGITTLLRKPELLLLEVGPGSTLATLARQNAAPTDGRTILPSLPAPGDGQSEAVTIQRALASLWVSGIVPSWEKLHGPGSRRRTSLPTYPFERKRFWFTNNGGESNVLQTAPPQETPDVSSTPAAAVRPRKKSLLPVLSDLFEDLSGLEISAQDGSASFLELGLDSLFLTQASQAIQNKFNVKVTFRQLLSDLASLDTLAAYLDAQLPPGAFEENEASTSAAPTPAPVAVVPPASSGVTPISGTASGSPLERLMHDQIQAMNQLFAQQLAMVQAGATPPTAAPASPAAAQPVRVAAPVSSSQPKDSAAIELKGYTPFRPLQKSVSGELTQRQVEHIRALTEKYTTRTAESKRKTQEYRGVLADPRVVAGFRVQWKEMIYPIITNRSKGSHIWDLDGNEYVDILNGFGPIMLGHRPDYVEKAIERQLHEGFETGPQTLLAGEVAQALCEMTGCERATFCNTGSEAVMAAMRVARTVTGRNRVVHFAGDYHGMFDEVLTKGIKRGGNPVSMPIAPGIPRESVTNMTVLDYGTAESLAWIRDHAHELAAILVEPVQSRHPNLQPIQFLKELRDLTEESGTCLIFDEVVTGFRVHPGGCQALFGIRADLATYGKVLAGGMPMGVLAGKAKYMDALDGGMWQYGDDSFPETGVTFFAGTFVRHPLAMAACAAVLKYLKEEGPGLQQRLTERTADLVARLNALLAANEVPTQIETFASFFYFSFPTDYRFSSLFYYHLRTKGIHLLEGFPCFLTTEHDDQDLDRIYRAFAETIAEMQQGELLPLPVGGTLPVRRCRRSPPATEAPITESQLEILLAAELSSQANCSFNESFSVSFTGDLNVPLLEESLSRLIARHEALRATFDLNHRIQHFSAPAPVRLPITDLSATDEAGQQAAYAALLREDAQTAFDLRNGPLVRMALARFDPQRHTLVVTAHHAVCDGWSINILLEELATIYAARSKGEEPALSPVASFQRILALAGRPFRRQGQCGGGLLDQAV